MINVLNTPSNDSGPSVPGTYPVQAEKRYYLKMMSGSTEVGRSYVFSTDGNGGHAFMGYIMPVSGTVVIHLCDEYDDGDVATLSVTVS
jgi:hypothetical protein